MPRFAHSWFQLLVLCQSVKECSTFRYEITKNQKLNIQVKAIVLFVKSFPLHPVDFIRVFALCQNACLFSPFYFILHSLFYQGATVCPFYHYYFIKNTYIDSSLHFVCLYHLLISCAPNFIFWLCTKFYMFVRI